MQGRLINYYLDAMHPTRLSTYKEQSSPFIKKDGLNAPDKRLEMKIQPHDFYANVI